MTWRLPGQALWERFRNHPLWEHPLPVALVTLAAIGLGLGLVYKATENWGPGANSDGLTYLVLARELHRRGRYGFPLPHGGLDPVSHFPPGYPLAIAVFMTFTHGDEALAALAVNMASLALVLALAAYEVYRATRHLFPTATTVLWLGVSFHLLRMFAGVWSEALFLAQIMAMAWAMERWRQRAGPSRSVLTGLLAAWSVSNRWLGLVLPAWTLVYLAWAWRKQRPTGWKQQVGAFLAASGGPILGLMLASRLADGAVASRTLGWHPPDTQRWLQAAYTLASWLVPHYRTFTPQEAVVRSAGLLVGLGLLVFLARIQAPAFPQRKRNLEPLEAFFVRWGSFAVLYALGLVTAIAFLDASTPMDWRLLAPEHLALSLLAGVAAWFALARWWPLALVLLWAWVHMMRTAKVDDEFFLLGRWHRAGALLRGEGWQTLDAWPALRSLPPKVPVYTNEREETLYYADRPAFRLRGRPVWREGRAFYCNPVQGECHPVPYTTPEDWAKDLAQRTQGTCALVLVLMDENVQLEEERAWAEVLLQDLRQAGFRVWKQLESGILLLPPETDPACLRAE